MRNIVKILAWIILGGCLFACNDKTEVETPIQKQVNGSNNTLHETKETKLLTRPRSLNIEPGDIVFGNPEASVILVEYFSPTCPHCVSYHKRTFPEIQKKYIDTKKIAYVMREFIGNKQDLDAAILARCSGSTSSYNKFITIILEQQASWMFNKNYREILTNIASLGGVSPKKYADCLNDEATSQMLIENTKLVAKEPNFVGTPSFFINGNQFLKPFSIEELSKALDAALSDGF